MAANSSHIVRIRRMVAEPNDDNGYTTDVLAEIIEQYPLADANGVAPGESGWVATYDLHAAAAEIWTEKAASRADNMDFSADGSRFDHADQYENAMKMARYYAARRAPGSIIVENKYPSEGDE